MRPWIRSLTTTGRTDGRDGRTEDDDDGRRRRTDGTEDDDDGRTRHNTTQHNTTHNATQIIQFYPSVFPLFTPQIRHVRISFNTQNNQ